MRVVNSNELTGCKTEYPITSVPVAYWLDHNIKPQLPTDIATTKYVNAKRESGGIENSDVEESLLLTVHAGHIIFSTTGITDDASAAKNMKQHPVK